MSSSTNILLVMTDQHRWDALGCSGGWVETPNIDRLAATGVHFRNAYTNAPVCIPARVSLALGRYPHNHGVRRNKEYTLPPNRNTWMRGIKQAGYQTSVFGKTHLHPHEGDLRENIDVVRGWGFDHVEEIAGPRASLVTQFELKDRWVEAGLWEDYRRDLRDRFSTKPWLVRPSPLPVELYPDVYVGRRAAEHIRTLDGDRPWFSWVSFSGPHEPYDPPKEYADRYDPASMPPPLPPWEDPRRRARGRLDRGKLRADFEPGEVAALRAAYAAKVTVIDDQVGELLRVVEERGDWDRTAVVFVSDHGEMNGDFGMLRKSNFLHPAVRIPLIVRVPGTSEGTPSDALVELMDVGATLAELAGVEQPRRSLARSLGHVIEDPSEPHRRAVLSEVQKEVMLATHAWKIGLNGKGETFLLFKLKSDPLEHRNLAGKWRYRLRERRLKAAVAKRIARAR